MLVLTRKKGETIRLGEEIEVTILDILGDNIKIGINAPKEVVILRKELYQEVKAENQVALATKVTNLKNIADILKKETVS